MTSVQMPQLGETIVEGTILKWLKQEGEHIEVDEPLFELSTDKVDTEVPSPVAGVLTKILVAEGTTVAVGTALAEVDSGDGAALGGRGASGASAPADASAAAQEPVAADAVGAAAPGSASAATPAAPRPPGSRPERSGRGRAGGVACRTGGPGRRSFRRSCGSWPRSTSLDLSQVSGSGNRGRITKKDVMDAVAAGGTTAPAAAPLRGAAPAAAAGARAAVRSGARSSRAGGEEVVPMTHIRKAIAVAHGGRRCRRRRARGTWSRSTWSTSCEPGNG